MIDFNKPTIDVITDISQGNPGALSLIMRFQKMFVDICFPCFLYDLDRKGLIGYKIWELYKDVHKESFTAFVEDVWTGAPLQDYLRDKPK